MTFLRAFLYFSVVGLCPAGIEAATPKLKFYGDKCTQGSRDSVLREISELSCGCVDRALFALTVHRPTVKKMFANGINFGVFFKNPDFYVKRLRNRQLACSKNGELRFRCVGRCNTAQQTLAYVKVTLGFVHSTVNVCDEFFDSHHSTRLDTIVHELGRLEGIGDSPNFDTNNIYVWDQVVGRMCDEVTYRAITKSE